jgi:MFS family permease
VDDVTPSLTDPHRERRWLILGVIAIAQLLVVLDVTIVNIALPSAQEELGFSDDERQWVITAYALAFGSLLLLGGRIADLFGRKWTFIAGLLGFAGASALGGGRAELRRAGWCTVWRRRWSTRRTRSVARPAPRC